jgi:excisionase family DNA binding protein
MAKPQPKTLTVKEAGKAYFGISKTAAYTAVKRGQIPVIKIGATYRVPVSALEKMLVEAGGRDKDGEK